LKVNKPKSEREEITDLVRDVIGTPKGESVVVLVAGALCDLRRIAAAVEKLQASNPDPKAPMSLRDLTPEEQATIEALRTGKIQVVKA
jgi:hypothetical protein